MRWAPGTLLRSLLQLLLLCAGGLLPLGSISLAVSAATVSDICEHGCGEGFFYSNCTASCVQCSPGFYCTGNLTAPTPCPAGTYGPNAGSVSLGLCLNCSLGHTSSPGAVQCSLCEAGTVAQAEGVAACASCGSGQVSTVNRTECIDCSYGTWADVNASTCTSCAAGFACPSRTSNHEVGCPLGSYAREGDGDCTYCPAGWACPSTSPQNGAADREPYACSQGTYSDMNQTACTSCPAMNYCPETTSGQAYPCPTGFYSLPAASNCTLCPEGFACPSNSTDGHPLICSTGEASLFPHTGCSACPAGYKCPDPTQLVQCQVGEYSPEGNLNCLACPPGYECLTPDATPTLCTVGHYSPGGLSQCSNCNITCGGFYIANFTGADACIACPAGSECRTNYDAPSRCGAGHYSGLGDQECFHCSQYTTHATLSLEGAESCTTCPAGYSCNDPALPAEACPAGTYTLGGAWNCTVCPAGYSCASVSAPPTGCAWNSYSLEGSTGCALCPANYRCANQSALPHLCDVEQGYYSPEGTTYCVECPSGSACEFDALAQNYTIQLCTSGQFRVPGNTACEDCWAGYRCPTVDNPPVTCPGGYYSFSKQTDCSPCSAGKSCYNGTSPQWCASGYYSEEFDNDCHMIEAGWASPNKWTVPAPCSMGTYSLGRASNCTECPSGWECPDTFTFATAVKCEPGTFSAGRQTSCTSCSPGFYCPYIDEAVVVPCDLGSYSNSRQQNCTACAPGYECPFANREQHAPRQCMDGTHSVGGMAACTVCPAGSACPYTTRDVVTPCINGTFTQPGETTCHTCDVGHYCPTTAVSASQPWVGPYGVGRNVPCGRGEYAPSGSVACTRCELGYICPTTSLPDGGKTLCADGTYPSSGSVFATSGATVCLNCPVAFECPTPYTPPKQCLSGTYSSASSQTACTRCPAGSMCPMQDSSPTPCPAGYWSYAQSVACQPCNPGYICPAGGTTPTPEGGECPVGSYCPAAATVPILCPAGTYGHATHGESANQACHDCPAGFYCAEGTAGISDNIKCPEGFYCPEGAPQATPCPSGTYSGTIGAITRTVCLMCPEGFYCPAGTPSYGTRDCPPGFYCPEGTGAEYENPCPPGTFQSLTRLVSVAQCQQCPAGSECPTSGQVNPTGCLPGTYQPLTGATRCKMCEPGWACELPQQTDSYMTPCNPGHYCPIGTALASAFPCPLGSYSFRTDLKRLQDCEICWRGYACPAGTGRSPYDSPVACAQGHYCPGVPSPGNNMEYYVASYMGKRAGAPTEFPCPQGSYTNATSLWSEEQCTSCPTGMYCLGGQAEPTALCGLGHYCPIRSFSPSQVPCLAGTYNDVEGVGYASGCKACLPGHYCPEGSSSMVPCPVGSYSPANNTVAAGPTKDPAAMMCLVCPAGYYCGMAAHNPVRCGIGFFSAEGAGECSVCEPGFYCPLDTTTADHKERLFQCPAGLFCGNGTDHVPQADQHACAAGYYCPTATPAPVPCPVGYYSNIAGLASMVECTPCDPGYYCALEGQTTVTGECAPGYYCRLGSTGARQTPCPARYYRLQTRAESEEFCAVCPRGSYCPVGTAAPFPCTRGYYCVAGTSQPEPCPIGTVGNSTDLRSQDECAACTAGYYCDGMGLTHPTGLCDPGYYCISRAFTSAPPGLPTGGLCPKGGYCPVGSSYPTACAEGTFNNFTGGSSQQDCIDCTPGYYCSGSNLPYPTGPCSAGYYCTGRAKLPTQFRTPAGHYTGPGSSAPSECPLGTFNPAVGQGECQPCILGNYCPQRAMITYLPCPEGSFCPAGSIVPESCPAGTYQPELRRQNITDCLACRGGHHCDVANASVPAGPCDAGYYCLTGCVTTTCSQYVMPGTTDIRENAAADFSSGTMSEFGGECTYGHYCPNSTAVPLACPAGTFRDQTLGRDMQLDCTPCTAGYYCDLTGMSFKLTGSLIPQQCLEGYYCPGSFTGHTCTSGYVGCGCYTNKCENHPGESTPTYASVDTSLQSAGARLCPRGHKCVAGSHTPSQCVYWVIDGVNVGTYQASMGKVVCDVCTPGNWCDYAAATNGYLSSYTPQPCIAGHYCEEGSTYSGQLCPSGSYFASTGASNVTNCNVCAAGSYCPQSGHTAIDTSTPACHPGYYCTSGASDGKGSVGILGGDSGPCPVGYICPAGTSSNVSVPCPPGTFNPYTHQSNESSCLTCTPGFYCQSDGLSAPTGHCKIGYYCPGWCTDDVCSNKPCTSNCAHPSPYESPAYAEGGVCPRSHYCPLGVWVNDITSVTETRGAASPIACPPGTYSQAEGASTCLDCPEGRWCNFALSTLSAHTPQLCPSGYYCNKTTEMPEATPCPPGTFSYVMGLSSVTECQLCEPGKYCPAPAATNATDYCPAGVYCEYGAASSNGTVGELGGSGGICPAGHWCGFATVVPERCTNGTYNPNTGSTSMDACLACTPGFYCEDAGISRPTAAVEAGYYAPLYCTDSTCSNTPCGSGCDFMVGGACPRGYSCALEATSAAVNTVLSGSVTVRAAVLPTPCAEGSYSPNVGAASCLVCPGGFYCPKQTTAPELCPEGKYCPEGTGLGIPDCPAGTFNNLKGLQNLTQCQLCSPGYYCADAGRNFTTGMCFAGWYCASGAAGATGDLGVMGGESGKCPQGYYCPTGTGANTTNPCPSGTFQPNMQATNSSACTPCTPGYYCESEGGRLPTSHCNAGYYCPVGCSDATCSTSPCDGHCANMVGGACPAGYKCPTVLLVDQGRPDKSVETLLDGLTSWVAAILPTPCNATTYASSTGQWECLDCPAGYYCGEAATNPANCPAGLYCPVGTGAYSDIPRCPPGSYSNATNRVAETDCTLCSGGAACTASALTAPDADCQAGYYCTAGAQTVISATGTLGGSGGQCPAGSYCPVRSAVPTLCAPGSYRATAGAAAQSDCTTCDAGKYCGSAGLTAYTGDCGAGWYCVAGSNVQRPTGAMCPEGHYCPTGSGGPLECPPGTYLPYTLATQLSECLGCAPGYYCDSGSWNATGLCAAGWYCSGNSTSPMPPNAAEGGRCTAGHYCPEGSGEMLTCDPGRYCDRAGLSWPTGFCFAGYYCVAGAVTPTPVDGTTGAACTAGHFCRNGSSIPEPCFTGTYNPNTHGVDELDCHICTPGYYCPSSAQSAVSLQCRQGYYCPGQTRDGASVDASAVYLCPLGHYCPTGSWSPLPCPPGTYAGSMGQTACTACTAGYYCDANDWCPGTNYTTPQLCPGGHYCPAGTKFGTEYPCTNGTYSNATGLEAPTDCTSCDPGWYCGSDGLQAPTGLCTQGYYCSLQSDTPQPLGLQTQRNGDITGNICPVGHYCPTGTFDPIACPIGTLLSATGATNETDCDPCTSGSYCATKGLSSETGVCTAGYYCPPGQYEPTPSLYVCPYGQFCVEGARTYNRCTDGTRALGTGQTSCETCPAGYYCWDEEYCSLGSFMVAQNCPEGYYCPAGTGHPHTYACPIGTYGIKANAATSGECADCPPGKYCDGGGGITRVTILNSGYDCYAGFYCTLKATSPGPIDGVLGNKCDPGHFCPNATGTPVPCPVGTMLDAEGAQAESDCLPCSPGAACTTTGLVFPDKGCEEKYYCPAGQSVAAPPAYECPTGYQCPSNSTEPQVCPAGSYQNLAKQSSCKICEAGYYCLAMADETWANRKYHYPRSCEPGYYCPRNSTSPQEVPCPVGTYNAVENATSLAECLECTAGRACTTPGLSASNADCQEGYLCTSGVDVTTPDGTTNTGTGGPCPQGSYCLTAAPAAEACPQGSYGEKAGLTRDSDCSPCTAGSYCLGGGAAATATCDAGYYCPGNNTDAKPAGYECPGGRYCPAGSAFPTQCPSGSYIPISRVASVSCDLCPRGMVCNLQEQQGAPWYQTSYYVTPVYCLRGYYCPEGTAGMHENPCPAGTYANSTSLPGLSDCVACSPGKYCLNPAAIHETGDCREGYYCLQSSPSPTPSVAVHGAAVGGQCPTGSYCPYATAVPFPCPVGTFSDVLGAINELVCAPCPAGRYCNQPGVGDRLGSGPCQGGYYCGQGETRPDPLGKICPFGHYCPEGSSHPIACPDGSYNDEIEQVSCKICPTYKFCNTASEAPEWCPTQYYCPEGTGYPNVCPPGTYSPGGDGSLSLARVEDCTLCPGGQYCNYGKVTGLCSAGFLCLWGNYLPQPRQDAIDQGYLLNGTVLTNGDICPIGYWCPEGTLTAIVCGNGTVGLRVGLRSEDECTTCPAGYLCIEHEFTMTPCPAGHYCPFGLPQTACPPGTYNNKTKGEDLSACVLCEAGYYCPELAMTTYVNNPTPHGHYSGAGHEASYPCPAGTYQPKGDGTAVSADMCLPCPVGYWCGPEASAFTHICPEGTYCPERSAAPVHCPSGFYCEYGKAKLMPCPEGYYCPPLSSYPEPCLNGTYCPGVNSVPYVCPMGWASRNDTAIRGTMNESCEVCPPGYYSANSLYCVMCDAGHVCLAGATTAKPEDRQRDGGYPCPVAHYCEPGTLQEQPCPPGTFYPGIRGKSIKSCTDCPSNSFNNLWGQDKCQDCGRSSTSPAGSTLCNCIGRNRVFQPSDKACVCEPNFVFHDGVRRMSEADSKIDCQERILPRCGPSDIRSASGQCINSASTQACKACPASQGSIDPTTGLCTCASLTFPNDVCNEACLSQESTVTIVGNDVVFSKNGVETVVPLNQAVGIFGVNKCTKNCAVKLIKSAPAATEAIFDAPQNYVEGLAFGTAGGNGTPQSFTSRRLLQVGGAATALKSMPNPAVCLNNGESIMFDVTEGYPKYLKDSLLNTNKNFDAGSFRELASQLNGQNPPTSFLNTFDEAGTYVFMQCTNNPTVCDENILTIVRVVETYERCPTGSQFQPITDTTLVQFGVERNTNIVLAPDWILIGVLLAGLFVLIVGIIAGLWHFRTQTWGMVGSSVPKYRTLGMASLETGEFAAIASKGTLSQKVPLKADGSAMTGDGGGKFEPEYGLLPGQLDAIKEHVHTVGVPTDTPWKGSVLSTLVSGEAAQTATALQRAIIECYTEKEGHVIDELADNLVYPQGVPPEKVLLAVCDQLSGLEVAARSTSEFLCTLLLTQEGADVDDMLGLKSGITQNEAPAAAVARAAREFSDTGSRDGVYKWAKVLGTVLAAYEPTFDRSLYAVDRNVDEAAMVALREAGGAGRQVVFTAPSAASTFASAHNAATEEDASVAYTLRGVRYCLALRGVSQVAEVDTLVPAFAPFTIQSVEEMGKALRVTCVCTEAEEAAIPPDFKNRVQSETEVADRFLQRLRDGAYAEAARQAEARMSKTMTLTLDMEFDQFDPAEFCTDVAETMGLNRNSLEVLSITPGSVIVRFRVVDSENADEKADEIVQQCQDPDSPLYMRLSDKHGRAKSIELAPHKDAATGSGGAGDAVAAEAHPVLGLEELEDEFWDYERQVDLEGFNVRTLYDKLEDQTIHIASQLANQADQQVLLYDKVNGETAALRDLIEGIAKAQKDLHEKKLGELPDEMTKALNKYIQTQFLDMEVSEGEESLDDRRENEVLLEGREARRPSAAASGGHASPRSEAALDSEDDAVEAGYDLAMPEELADDKKVSDDERVKLMHAREEWRRVADVRKAERGDMPPEIVDDAALSPAERLERLLLREQWRRDGQCPFSALDDPTLPPLQRGLRAVEGEGWRRQRGLLDDAGLPAELRDSPDLPEAERLDRLLERQEWRRAHGLTPDDTTISADPQLTDDPSLPVAERRARAEKREALRAAMMLTSLEPDLPPELEPDASQGDEEFVKVANERDRWRREHGLAVSRGLLDDEALPREDRVARFVQRQRWKNSNAFTPSTMTDLPDEPVEARLKAGLEREARWHKLLTATEVPIDPAGVKRVSMSMLHPRRPYGDVGRMPSEEPEDAAAAADGDKRTPQELLSAGMEAFVAAADAEGVDNIPAEIRGVPELAAVWKLGAVRARLAAGDLEELPEELADADAAAAAEVEAGPEGEVLADEALRQAKEAAFNAGRAAANAEELPEEAEEPDEATVPIPAEMREDATLTDEQNAQRAVVRNAFLRGKHFAEAVDMPPELDEEDCTIWEAAVAEQKAVEAKLAPPPEMRDDAALSDEERRRRGDVRKAFAAGRAACDAAELPSELAAELAEDMADGDSGEKEVEAAARSRAKLAQAYAKGAEAAAACEIPEDMLLPEDAAVAQEGRARMEAERLRQAFARGRESGLPPGELPADLQDGPSLPLPERWARQKEAEAHAAGSWAAAEVKVGAEPADEGERARREVVRAAYRAGLAAPASNSVCPPELEEHEAAFMQGRDARGMTAAAEWMTGEEKKRAAVELSAFARGQASKLPPGELPADLMEEEGDAAWRAEAERAFALGQLARAAATKPEDEELGPEEFQRKQRAQAAFKKGRAAAAHDPRVPEGLDEEEEEMFKAGVADAKYATGLVNVDGSAAATEARAARLQTAFVAGRDGAAAASLEVEADPELREAFEHGRAAAAATDAAALAALPPDSEERARAVRTRAAFAQGKEAEVGAEMPEEIAADESAAAAYAAGQANAALVFEEDKKDSEGEKARKAALTQAFVRGRGGEEMPAELGEADEEAMAAFEEGRFAAAVFAGDGADAEAEAGLSDEQRRDAATVRAAFKAGRDSAGRPAGFEELEDDVKAAFEHGEQAKKLTGVEERLTEDETARRMKMRTAFQRGRDGGADAGEMPAELADDEEAVAAFQRGQRAAAALAEASSAVPEALRDSDDLSEDERRTRAALRAAYAQGRAAAEERQNVCEEMMDEDDDTAESRAAKRTMRAAFATGRAAAEGGRLQREQQEEMEAACQHGDAKANKVLLALERGREAARAERMVREMENDDAFAAGDTGDDSGGDARGRATLNAATKRGMRAAQAAEMPRSLHSGPSVVGDDDGSPRRRRSVTFKGGRQRQRSLVSTPGELEDDETLPVQERRRRSILRQAFAAGTHASTQQARLEGLMQEALADDPNLPDAERARRAELRETLMRSMEAHGSSRQEAEALLVPAEPAGGGGSAGSPASRRASLVLPGHQPGGLRAEAAGPPAPSIFLAAHKLKAHSSQQSVPPELVDDPSLPAEDRLKRMEKREAWQRGDRGADAFRTLNLTTPDQSTVAAARSPGIGPVPDQISMSDTMSVCETAETRKLKDMRVMHKLRMRDLRTKQDQERHSDLERLQEEADEELLQIDEQIDDKLRAIQDTVANDMAAELERSATEEERVSIKRAFDDRLKRETDGLEQVRQEKKSAVRKHLAARKERKQKVLAMKHKDEQRLEKTVQVDEKQEMERIVAEYEKRKKEGTCTQEEEFEKQRRALHEKLRQRDFRRKKKQQKEAELLAKERDATREEEEDLLKEKQAEFEAIEKEAVRHKYEQELRDEAKQKGQLSDAERAGIREKMADELRHIEEEQKAAASAEETARKVALEKQGESKKMNLDTEQQAAKVADIDSQKKEIDEIISKQQAEMAKAERIREADFNKEKEKLQQKIKEKEAKRAAREAQMKVAAREIEMDLQKEAKEAEEGLLKEEVERRMKQEEHQQKKNMTPEEREKIYAEYMEETKKYVMRSFLFLLRNCSAPAHTPSTAAK